jgi:hypothetical protein
MQILAKHPDTKAGLPQSKIDLASCFQIRRCVAEEDLEWLRLGGEYHERIIAEREPCVLRQSRKNPSLPTALGRLIERHDPLFENRRGIGQCLGEIFGSQLRPLLEDLLAGRPGAEVGQERGDGESQSADAGLSKALLGVKGNAVELVMTYLQDGPSFFLPAS